MKRYFGSKRGRSVTTLIVVAATSLRAVRVRMQREVWYFIHLYAYLAVALGFAHQFAVGTDFVHDPVARAWWIAYISLFVRWCCAGGARRRSVRATGSVLWSARFD